MASLAAAWSPLLCHSSEAAAEAKRVTLGNNPMDKAMIKTVADEKMAIPNVEKAAVGKKRRGSAQTWVERK
jgi:hypothetical protein